MMNSERLALLLFQWPWLSLGSFAGLEEIRADQWGHDVLKTVLLVTVTDDTYDFDDGSERLASFDKVAGGFTTSRRQ